MAHMNMVCVGYGVCGSTGFIDAQACHCKSPLTTNVHETYYGSLSHKERVACDEEMCL
ncbi:MAG: hypothetical protein GDA54_02145 [Alphaproteobacteria bacterium GM7ARS4]|nr:hypothetical protein [Alphaproteobacteria bacterium GM7ARS4]